MNNHTFMAYANSTPARDPVQNVGQPPDLGPVFLRQWCQHQATMALLSYPEFRIYSIVVSRYFDGISPYDRFRMELETLMKCPGTNYWLLQPYWDLYHRESIEGRPIIVDALFFYPIDLYRSLSRIPYPQFTFEPSNTVRALDPRTEPQRGL